MEFEPVDYSHLHDNPKTAAALASIELHNPERNQIAEIKLTRQELYDLIAQHLQAAEAYKKELKERFGE